MRRKRVKSPLKQATLESRRRAPFRGWMCENCQEKKVNWQYKKTEREIQFEIILCNSIYFEATWNWCMYIFHKNIVGT